ncbi:MAG: hypothetical protein IJB48_00245, partial [Clostridia bacterium]|nr:hypothetical protein [Clostridia bacterium]
PYESSLITTGREMINQWKVTISYLTAEHAGQTDKEGRKIILSSLDIIVQNEICNETYMVVDSFDTREEAEHLFLYLKTRFVRFLISQLASTQHLSKEKFAYVPILNFANTYLPVSKTTVFSNITTVVSVVAGVVFLGEPFGAVTVCSALMIVVGVWGAQRTGQKTIQ